MRMCMCMYMHMHMHMYVCIYILYTRISTICLCPTHPVLILHPTFFAITRLRRLLMVNTAYDILNIMIPHPQTLNSKQSEPITQTPNPQPEP